MEVLELDKWLLKNKLLGLDMKVIVDRFIHIISGKINTLEIPDSIRLGGIRRDVECDSLILGKGCDVVAEKACHQDCKVKNILINSEFIEIGNEAFFYLSSLCSLDFGDLSESIKFGSFCFSNCKCLESVKFSAGSDVVLCESAFSYCDSLKNVINLESLNSLKLSSSCFQGCKSLERITLPDNTVVEPFVFSCCYNLKEVTFRHVEFVPRCNGVFDDCDSGLVINLPKLYKHKNFDSIFGISIRDTKFKNINFY